MTRVPIQEVMQMAARQSDAGAFAEAERAYRHILAQVPDYPEALYALGMLMARFAEREEAIDLLRKATIARPDSAEYHQSLGTAYKSAGRITEAIASFERAVEIRPEFDAARFALSAAQMEQMELAAPACRISYLIASRNDHFCGNPMDRLRLVLKRVLEVGEDFEVIVADWGSDVPIYEVMKGQLPATGKIRFLHISNNITGKIPTPFSEVHALNAAVRRSRGIFAGRIDQDTLIGKRFSGWVTHVLDAEDRRAYFSMRRDLKRGETAVNADAPVWQGCPADWEHYLIGAVGILLAPRRLWHWTRGYDERLVLRNHMEHDLCMRFGNLTGLRNLGAILDCDFYHLWHEEAAGAAANPQKTLDQLANDAKQNLRANDENWGLGAMEGEIVERVI
jgi:hypothetical protein